MAQSNAKSMAEIANQNIPEKHAWVAFYGELAPKLLEYRSRQEELIGFLEDLRGKGYPITSLRDRYADGSRALVTELDPFTFFGVFNRGITSTNRIKICEEIKDKFDVVAPAPKEQMDFYGIPVLNNMNSWFMSFADQRGENDVDTFWDVFEEALDPEPFNNPNFLNSLDKAFSVRNINKNMTMALYWIRPETFINMDEPMCEYLGIKVPRSGMTSDFYKEQIDSVRKKFPELPFPEISMNAIVSQQEQISKAKNNDANDELIEIDTSIDYWFVNAWWKGRPYIDQTSRFLEEGLWESENKGEKTLEEMQSMKVGDRIAIKQVRHPETHDYPFDNKGARTRISHLELKATGHISANHGDGRLGVTWDEPSAIRKWYFFTFANEIWRLNIWGSYGNWRRRLIRFAFHGDEQDYDFFKQYWFPSNSEEMDAEGDEGVCWFVGAYHDDQPDLIPDMIKNGYWENGYNPPHQSTDHVKSMQIGDRIAIKATFVKREFPFENFGEPISVMRIKATGTITENLGDGKRVLVDWNEDAPTERDWLFFTFMQTVWKIEPKTTKLALRWKRQALIRFTFENESQGIERFYEEWKKNYLEKNQGNDFEWVEFYEQVADSLLTYRDVTKRTGLLEKCHEICDDMKSGFLTVADTNKWMTEDEKDTEGLLGKTQHMCPFTAFAIFNRSQNNQTRATAAKKFADFLELDAQTPSTFQGTEILNSQEAWFWNLATATEEDLNNHWGLFESAIKYADSNDLEDRSQFINYFERIAPSQLNKVTKGLSWFRPQSFPGLSGKSREYIRETLKLKVTDPHNLTGDEYLNITEQLLENFDDEEFPVHSFPELAAKAASSDSKPEEIEELLSGENEEPFGETKPERKPYSIRQIIDDGCFIPEPMLHEYLERLKTKKNIILQGPPGTGKTWLAKKLGFALIGFEDEQLMTRVQFHPNLSYEDFIRGWRPVGEGKLELADGPLMYAINKAIETPDENHVVVIEEVNRGNPAQIFGEMLTLLEPDKRSSSEALKLSYSHDPSETVYVPANLYLIGTMNIADRSLALVDLALRRRFAFLDLEPQFNQAWAKWSKEHGALPDEFVNNIRTRINTLNTHITESPALGAQFVVGHSYLTPHENTPISDSTEWFKQVVITEIRPLLEEYWFDQPETAAAEVKLLLEGF